MDFIVDLPPLEGHTTIFVVVDCLSKMVHFLPMMPTSKDTVDIFIREIFRLHGLPASIVSDRRVQFTSKFWKGLCKSLAVDVRLSSAYHPQSNEQMERTLQQYLRCFSSFSQRSASSLTPDIYINCPMCSFFVTHEVWLKYSHCWYSYIMDYFQDVAIIGCLSPVLQEWSHFLIQKLPMCIALALISEKILQLHIPARILTLLYSFSISYSAF